MVIQKKVEVINNFSGAINIKNTKDISFLKNNTTTELSNNKMIETTNNVCDTNQFSENYSKKYIQHIKELKKEAFKDLQLQIQRENYSWWKKQYYLENKKKNEEEKHDYSTILHSEPNRELNNPVPIYQKSSSFLSDCSASSSSSSEDFSSLQESKANIKKIKKPTYKANPFRQNNNNDNNDALKFEKNEYDKSPSIFEGKRERKIDINDEYFFNSSKRNKYNCQDNNSHKNIDEIHNNLSYNSVFKYYSNNKSHFYRNSVYNKERINNNLSYKNNEGFRNSHSSPSLYNSKKRDSKSNSLIMHETILNNTKRISNDTNFYFKYEKKLPKFSLSLHNNSDNETENDDVNGRNEVNEEITNINLDDIHEESSNESDEEDDSISIKLYTSSLQNNDNNLLFMKNNIKEKRKLDRDGNITNNSFNSDKSIHLDSNGNSPNNSDLLTSSSSPILNIKTIDEKKEVVKIKKNKENYGDKELSSLYQLCKTMSVNDYSEVIDYEDNFVSISHNYYSMFYNYF